MKKIIFCVIACCIALSSCTTVSNENRFTEKLVKKVTLNNGKVITVTYHPPKAAYECQTSQIPPLRENWGEAKLSGTFHGGPAGELEKKAINQLNTSKSISNYLYVKMPDETKVGFFDDSIAENGYVYFFECKHPPKKDLNPF